MAVTPTKVYAKKLLPDSSCHFCDFDFIKNNKKPAYNIFENHGRLSLKAAEFQALINKVLGCEITRDPNLSSVSCKSCHTKIERYSKVIDEMINFKNRVINYKVIKPY